jgi:hypothetical protein
MHPCLARRRRTGIAGAALDQLEGGAHRLNHLLVTPRLGDEIDGAPTHPLNGQLDRAPRGDQNHRQIGKALLDLGQQLEALFTGGAPGEVHVLQDQLEIGPVQVL